MLTVLIVKLVRLMDLHYTYTRLNVEDFQACKAFYQNVLGLSIKFEDDRDEYVEFDTGSVQITLFNRQKVTQFITRDAALSYDPYSARVVLSFLVSDLKTAIAQLQTQGVKFLNPPTNYPGRGFTSACFRDPDGNLIELAQIQS